MRIDWAEEIKNGKRRFKIIDEVWQMFQAGEFVVVVENIDCGIFTVTKAVWERGGIIKGEPLVVWDEVEI